MANNTDNLEEIDLRQIIRIFTKRKKVIMITLATTILTAVAYLLLATPWYEVKAFIEIGKYRENNKEIPLEKGSKVAQRLSVKYIDIYKNLKNRKVETISITPIKKNEDFVAITIQAHNNDLAKKELYKIVNNLQKEHQKIINEILKSKQFLINKIDREINQINTSKMKDIEDQISFLIKSKLPNINNKINLLKNSDIPNIDKKIEYLTKNTLPSIEQKIKYIKNNQIPAIDKKIKYILNNQIPAIDKKIIISNTDLADYEKQLTSAKDNLSSLSAKNTVLSALRLTQIETLRKNISHKRIDIIELENVKRLLTEDKLISLKNEKEHLLRQEITSLINQKDSILKEKIPELKNKKNVLLKDKLKTLAKEYNEIQNIDLPKLKRKKYNLINNDLFQLKENKELIKISMRDYNFRNSQIIGSIIYDNNPSKPKKLLILAISILFGLILSFFIIFLLELMNSFKKTNIIYE